MLFGLQVYREPKTRPRQVPVAGHEEEAVTTAEPQEWKGCVDLTLKT